MFFPSLINRNCARNARQREYSLVFRQNRNYLDLFKSIQVSERPKINILHLSSLFLTPYNEDEEVIVDSDEEADDSKRYESD